MKRIIVWTVVVCGTVLLLSPSWAAEGTGELSRVVNFSMECPQTEGPVWRAMYVFDPELPANTTGILSYTLDYAVADAAVLSGLQLDWDMNDEDYHEGQNVLNLVDAR